MVMKERLSWILDRPELERKEMREKLSGEEYSKWYSEYLNENWQKNIEFVHSLGLKCDCVGWSNLDLTRPDAGEILDKIEQFCKENGWLARGGYSRSIEECESEWYELAVSSDVDAVELVKLLSDNGESVHSYAVRAYKNKNRPILTGWGYRLPYIVSERFREVCLQNNIEGIDFCWVQDKGKYKSQQYFFIYPERHVPRIACDKYLKYSDSAIHRGAEGIGELAREHLPGSELYKDLEQLGGFLPRLAEIFYDFRFSLPDYYPAEDMPNTGFVYAYWGQGGYFSREKLLVHGNTAEILIKEKVLSRKSLAPSMLYTEVPAGYREVKLNTVPKPGRQHIDDMQKAYSEFIKTTRPEWKATEKEALRKLREAKRERKDDFNKRLQKKKADKLTGTPYQAILPYYMVADGGQLSDEYEFMAYVETSSENEEFSANMAKEELVENAPEGNVIARCPNGDVVIVCHEGTVARVSHEVPEMIEEWPSVAQFFVDTIEN